ncbi:ATP-dependent helicase [Streptomyces radicis]|uniref:DNA 3'-5' helicase n=1 Tax=Streptomyces radicis TaxID=1750517 RepID=A0A3A9W8B7_9ACTN|nr:ATP-dependent DNA helicase [Streptomyces radicis]RKN09009.1 ATP-dependent helicase [Streptomyces radicis]RKN22800.1 ATP-dependent helicase [Streptomyces radicis]
MHVSLSVPFTDRPPAPGAYRLVRAPVGDARVVAVDASQRQVVDHRGGPLLVLAGPGTGKTTTLVEAVARRVTDGTDPERVLVLTFSRKAAAELRDRLTARLGGASPQATTFHSFAYAFVRAHQDRDLFAEPLRLLSGPEQDLYLRELLAGHRDPGASGSGVEWPDELRACLTTRGFADELRAVLARSREIGLEPDTLAGFARRTGRPDWEAAAHFLAEYLDVTEAQGVLDYTELVRGAARLADDPGVAAAVRARYDAVFVDEYQDTDPAQVALLRALAGGGRDLVVFGDPDQAIYAFRGGDVNGILGFPDAFRTRAGDPAPVAVLRTGRRSGAALLAATRLLAQRMPLSRLPADAVRGHRALTAERDGGRVEVRTYPTPGAELDNIADLLRRAHLEDGVPWGDMAVLVRAGARSIPVVRRALTAAGVPLEVDGDDLPLRQEPAVAPLLMALRAVAGPGPDEGAALAPEDALKLLTSPLGGMDAADLRRLGRALRNEERAAGVATPRPSDELIARALAEPERLVTHDPAYAGGAQRLGTLLRKARELLAGGGSAEEALWLLWDGTPWPGRLERAARRGGAAGRNADRDLDAMCALFDAAARAEERTGGRGARNFLAELEAHDIAADTLAPRAVRPEAVRLMTAHRSKGLEWSLVVVAGVQEGLWPDLRRRGSLLEADRIGRDGLAEPLSQAALLAEERRLFYVAATRARDHLVVTAVRGADDGDQPSRFLRELGVEPEEVSGRPRRPLALAALIAELRATTVDPDASPALRRAAAERLAELAALTDDEGHALAPAAHPERWWGLREPTRSAAPVRDPEAPVALSGSALDQLVNTCSLQWFLGREVHADAPATTAQGFGNVLHVLADEVASGTTPADLSVLMERLDTVWDSLAFEAPWQSRREQAEARAALERFLRWHVLQRADGREPVASEAEFDVTLDAGPHSVRIRGVLDRVERDAEGRAYVVDFKTGRTRPTRREVERHPQLAVYQLALRHGEVPGAGDPAGAALVHLRQGAPAREGGDALPTVQRQEPLGREGNGDAGGDWVGDLLANAAGRVLDERFTPHSGQHCGSCSFRGACGARPEGRHVVD